MTLAELDRGCHGGQVRLLQHLLNTAPGHRGTLRLDGLFGARTDEAVRGYQFRHHLAVDGVVGRHTWAKLGLNDGALPHPRAGAASPAPIGGRPPAPTAIGGRPSAPVPAHRSPVPAPVRAPAPVAVPRSTPMPAAAPLPAAGNAPWMAVAEAEKWVHERTPNGTKRIIEYHATTCGLRSDQVAWCSSFVNWCLRQVHIRGTDNALAISWAHWGQELAEPRFGAIVQLHHGARGHDRRTGSSSGNHVGFLVSKTATHVTLLGGNQGDSVKLSNFPLASYRINAMRWPA